MRRKQGSAGAARASRITPIPLSLTLVLAFGPFVVLGGLVWWRRRADEGTDLEQD